jgi:myo-inositol-1(or 4)-monophosphatase
MSLKAELDTAHALADLAAGVTLKHFRRPIAVTNKDARGFDPVTVADQGAEKAMRKALAARHPDHGVIGEEFAATAGGSNRDWILDPIDGTKAFILGYPMWGTLIGLLDGGAPILGMMDQPFTRERFYAVAPAAGGTGAFIRIGDGKPKRLSTRACPKLSDAVLTATGPDMFKSAYERAAFAALSRAARLTRFGGDCYMYMMLAAGHVDLVVEAGLKAVDIAPLVPIIEAAGGVVTSWDGGAPTAGGQIVAAGDPALHRAVVKILGNHRSDVMTA